MSEEIIVNQQEQINIEEIQELISERKFTKLKDILAEENPADIAVVFDEVDKKHWLLLFRVLPKELAAETFAYLETDMQ